MAFFSYKMVVCLANEHACWTCWLINVEKGCCISLEPFSEIRIDKADLEFWEQSWRRYVTLCHCATNRQVLYPEEIYVKRSCIIFLAHIFIVYGIHLCSSIGKNCSPRRSSFRPNAKATCAEERFVSRFENRWWFKGNPQPHVCLYVNQLPFFPAREVLVHVEVFQN